MTEQAILQQLQSMQAEMAKIRQENQILREQQTSQNQIGASLVELTAQLKAQIADASVFMTHIILQEIKKLLFLCLNI